MGKYKQLVVVEMFKIKPIRFFDYAVDYFQYISSKLINTYFGPQ